MDYGAALEMRFGATRRGFESRPLRHLAPGLVILAGQACYTAGEWDGDPEALEGRSSAPDVPAYDWSIQRLRDLAPARVRFGHDRASWSAR